MGGGESKSAQGKGTATVKRNIRVTDESLLKLIELKQERRSILAEKAGLEKVIGFQTEYASNNKFKNYLDVEKKKNELNNDRITMMEYAWEHDVDSIVRVSTRIDENNSQIAQLLATRTRWQLHLISDSMKRKYGMTLFEMLQTIYGDADANEKYTKVLLGYRVADPVERDVILLHSYVAGANLQIKEIIEVVMTRNNDELRNIVTAYLAKYGKGFGDHFRAKCKDQNLTEFMIKVLECSRDEFNEPFDEETAKAKAIQLYDAAAGKTFGPYDAGVFIRVLCNVSVAQFDSINNQYNHKQLRQDIVRFLPGAFCGAVLARSSEKFHTLALYLKKSIKKETLNLSSAVGILGSLSHSQCVNLRVAYDASGDMSLVDSLRLVVKGPLLVACEALLAGDVRFNPVGSYREAGRDEKQCEAAFKEAAIAAKENYKAETVQEVGEKELVRRGDVDDIPLPASPDEFRHLSSSEQRHVILECDKLIIQITGEMETLKADKRASKRNYIETSGKLAEDLVWIKIITAHIEALSSYIIQCDCTDIHREFSNPKKMNVDRANKTLIRIMCRRDRKHWAKMEERYEQYTKKTLMSIIGSREVEDHIQPFLINIKYSATNKTDPHTNKIIRGVFEMDVNRIHNFIKKFSNREEGATLDYLLEIILTRTNREMLEIKSMYIERQQVSMENALQPVIEEFPYLFSLIAICLRGNRDESGLTNRTAAVNVCNDLIARRNTMLSKWNDEVQALEKSYYEAMHRERSLAAATAAAAAPPPAAVTPPREDSSHRNIRAAELTEHSEDIKSMLSRATDVEEESEFHHGNHLMQIPAIMEETQANGSNCPTPAPGDFDAQDFAAAVLADRVSKDKDDEPTDHDWSHGVAATPAKPSPATPNLPRQAPVPKFVAPPVNKAKRSMELFELYVSMLGQLGLSQLKLVQTTFDEVAQGKIFLKSLVDTIKEDLEGTPQGNIMLDALCAWLGDRVLYCTRVIHQAIAANNLQPSLIIRLFTRCSLLDCRKIIHSYKQNYDRYLDDDLKIHLEPYQYLLQAILSFVFEDDNVDVGDPRLRVMIKRKDFVGTPRPTKPVSNENLDLSVNGINSLSVFGGTVAKVPMAKSTDAAAKLAGAIQGGNTQGEDSFKKPLMEVAVSKRMPRSSFMAAYTNKVAPV